MAQDLLQVINLREVAKIHLHEVARPMTFPFILKPLLPRS
jgi:hypothetical protein